LRYSTQTKDKGLGGLQKDPYHWPSSREGGTVAGSFLLGEGQ